LFFPLVSNILGPCWGVVMALPIPKVALRGGNVFETMLSASVILVAIGFLVFLFARTGTGHLGSYPLRVRMADASGLTIGSDVRLGGTKIGSATGLWLDKSDYSAVVETKIRDDLALPVDSGASIASTALSNAYLSISPGHASQNARPDGEIGSRPARHR